MLRFFWFVAASCTPVAFFLFVARRSIDALIVVCPAPPDAPDGAVAALKWCLGEGFDAGVSAGTVLAFAQDLAARYDYGIGISAMALAMTASALCAVACILRLERPRIAGAILSLAALAAAWTLWQDLAASTAAQRFVVEDTLRAIEGLGRHAEGDAERLIGLTNLIESAGYVAAAFFLAALGVVAMPPERRSAEALRSRRRWLGLLLGVGAFQFVCFVFATRAYLQTVLPYLEPDWRVASELMSAALGRYWGFLGSAMLAISGGLALASFAAETRALSFAEGPSGGPEARRDWLKAEGLDLPLDKLLKQGAVVLAPFLSSPLFSLAKFDFSALSGL